MGITELLWRPIVALALLCLDPLRTIGGLLLGLFVQPWWVVVPGVVALSIILEFVWAQLGAHTAGATSIFAGSIVSLIAAWTGLSWRGRLPRPANEVRRDG